MTQQSNVAAIAMHYATGAGRSLLEPRWNNEHRANHRVAEGITEGIPGFDRQVRQPKIIANEDFPQPADPPFTCLALYPGVYSEGIFYSNPAMTGHGHIFSYSSVK